MEQLSSVVDFELAKLLEEKGFDDSTEANWWILAKDHAENYNKKLPVNESKVFFTKDSYELELKTQIDEENEHNVYHVLSAPTIAETIDWIYNKHKIWIAVELYYNPQKYDKKYFEYGISYIETGEEGLYNNLTKRFDSDWVSNPEDYNLFNSPKEAYLAGIKEVLTNLI